jgi:3D-(3,5/4)-trihydroxycyclohexane-1,2-dione acylhydrolase (decyclizing)
VTAVQEGIKVTVVLIDNHGFGSIGALSESLGSEGFGTSYRYRTDAGLDGATLPVDFAANARSLGAHVIECSALDDLRAGLAEARDVVGPVVLSIEVDPTARVGGYGSWWDVPVAEVSEAEAVKAAREAYEQARRSERWHL